MPKATKICKVCGKEYEYCHSVKVADGVFRYQDVACCPEHALIYFARVDEARGNTGEYKEAPKTRAKTNKQKIVTKPETLAENASEKNN